MWKICVFVFLLFLCNRSLSQNVFPTTGKAGIGTTTPAAPLHIVGYDWDKIILEELGTSSLGRIQFINSSNVLYLGTVGSNFTSSGHVKPNTAFFTYTGSTGIHLASVGSTSAIRFYVGGGDDVHERVRIDATGKFFGLGFSRTSTPRDSMVSMDPTTKELQVSPIRPARMRFVDTRGVATNPTYYNNNFHLQLKNKSELGLPIDGTNTVSVVGFRGGNADSLGKGFELAFSNENQVWFRGGYLVGWDGWKKMVLDSAGIVRIGTTTNRAALHVNGEVFTRKVKVTQNNWPDYVFSSAYHLPSLYEVESHIQKFQHLPNVPSAADIEKNGLDLGDGQAVLLRKIEELTLYSIQQQKELDALKEQNKKMSQLLDLLLLQKHQSTAK
jgi:hypothetical protein